MKISPLVVIALLAQSVLAKDDKKKSSKKKEKCTDVEFDKKPSKKFACPVQDTKHYLVRLLL